MEKVFFGRSPRAVATFVCYVANGTDRRVKDLLERELERSGFERRDRDLATELAYGMLRRRGTLDHLLARFSRIPLKKLQPRVLEVLRLGAYQLLFLDKVPAPAAVHEAVEIAKRVTSPGAVGFVNACLRALLRAIVSRASGPGDDPRKALPVGEDAWCIFGEPVLPEPRRWPARYLAAAHSHPEWLMRRWLARFGEEACRRLCEANNRHAGLTLRVNRQRATREALIAELVREGRWAKPLGADHVLVDQAGSLAGLAPLRDGLCTVQGVAASAAAALLAPRPGELVLDLCSAPGSKACQLAELAGGEARILALDISPVRLRLVAENARRLGARTVWPVAADGTACERLLRAECDAALVDVPCSNTAVLMRRVESRWRLSEARIAELAELQRRLIASAAAVVRPGGRLVYSTCSLEAEENEQVAEWLCGTLAGWRLAESRYILPQDTGADGGYVALAQRVESA